MTHKKYKVRVGRKADIAQGIVEITLFGVNQELLPAFAPGAHVDLYLPNGLVRAYSLTNASRAEGSESYVLAIGRAQSSRGGSSFIHDLLREGDSLEVGAPRNLFPLKVDSAPVLLIAGGIGITPLQAMARQRESESLPWQLIYAARNKESAAYVAELSDFSDAVRFHFDDESGGPIALESVLAHLLPGTHVYCCGPKGLMDAVRALTISHPPGHVHFESFGGEPSVQSGQSEHGFLVELARQGRVVVVAHNQSIVDCLEACGVVIPTVCREGICGACECSVLMGEIDHRDQILSDAEKQAGKTMMICVSRARGDRLVLDV